MQKKNRRAMAKRLGDAWFVYVARCADGSLYTGITKDVKRRCEQHNAGTASKYTRSRLLVKLVYQEAHPSHCDDSNCETVEHIFDSVHGCTPVCQCRGLERF